MAHAEGNLDNNRYGVGNDLSLCYLFLACRSILCICDPDDPSVVKSNKTQEIHVTAQWYVIHVHSGFEKKIAQSIRDMVSEKGLENKILDVLVPTEEVVMIRRGTKANSERKFFPGYVLIYMEQQQQNDEVWHLIKTMPKVTKFLGSAGKSYPISDAEAQHILNQVKEGIERPKPAMLFEIGEQVRVCDGPFNSFNGFIEEVDKEKSRLKITVSIFGRSTPVELEYSQVEKM